MLIFHLPATEMCFVPGFTVHKEALVLASYSCLPQSKMGWEPFPASPA